MTLESLYFLSQVVAAIALVGSLVFVGIQIRQNSRTQKAQGNAAHWSRIAEFQWRMVEPEFARLMFKGSLLTEPMTEEERARYVFLVIRVIQGTEEVEYLYRAGQLDKAQRLQTDGALHFFMQYPGFRVACRNYLAGTPHCSIRELLEQFLEQYAGTKPPNGKAIWESFVEVELAAGKTKDAESKHENGADEQSETKAETAASSTLEP